MPPQVLSSIFLVFLIERANVDLFVERQSGLHWSQYQSFKTGEAKVTTNRSGISEGSRTKRLPYTNFVVEVLTQNRNLLINVEILFLFSDKTSGNKLLFWI